MVINKQCLEAQAVSQRLQRKAIELQLAGTSWPGGCGRYVREVFRAVGINLPEINYDGTAESVLTSLKELSELYKEVDTPSIGCVIIGKDPQSALIHLYLVEDENTVSHMYDQRDGLRLGIVRHPIKDIEVDRILKYVGPGHEIFCESAG